MTTNIFLKRQVPLYGGNMVEKVLRGYLQNEDNPLKLMVGPPRFEPGTCRL